MSSPFPTSPISEDDDRAETATRRLQDGRQSTAIRRFAWAWRDQRDRRPGQRRLRELAVLLRPYRWRIAGMFLSLIVATAAGLAPPLLAKLAIDDGIAKGDSGVLTMVVIAFIASALVLWIATYVQTYLVGWIGQRVLQNLRIELFDHLQKMSVGFYSRRRTGVLVSRLTNDIQALDQLVTDGIVTLFQSTVMLAAMAGILIVDDLPLALACFGVIPIVAIASFVFRVLSADVYRSTRERIGAVTAYLQETISGVHVVRSYGREARHVDEFAELSAANRDTNMRSVQLNAAYFPAVELLSSVGLAIVVLFGGYRVIAGDMTTGSLVLFAGYVQSFFDPIQQLSQLYNTYQSGMAALDKIFELLGETPELEERANAFSLPALRGEIEFDDVWFSYSADGPSATGDTAIGSGRGDDNQESDGEAAGNGGRDKDSGEVTVDAVDEAHLYALAGVNLRIAPGETLALVGATGAGKSTFAKLVARFYDPQRGSVSIDGHDLRDVRADSLRRQLGYVPQEGYLFSGTIAQNIEFGQPGASRDEITAAARAVGAADAIAGLPDGFDTVVGERGGQLSAGQRQLVAFARALIASPRLLILDEATASVDVGTEMKIEDGLRRLLAGRTAIVIAHRLSTIINATRIAVLEHGQIVELGSHKELIAAGGRYADLYASWESNVA